MPGIKSNYREVAIALRKSSGLGPVFAGTPCREARGGEAREEVPLLQPDPAAAGVQLRRTVKVMAQALAVALAVALAAVLAPGSWHSASAAQAPAGAPSPATTTGIGNAREPLNVLRIALLKFGSVNWLLDVLRHHRLDQKHGFKLDITALASTQATKTALETGSADLIVSDWLWTAQRRGRGANFTFVPYSTAVGALMVPAASNIRSLKDLKGKRIAVAGGPLDKSWLILKALAMRDHKLDLDKQATIVYGAPPLLAKKAEQGEFDAILNYWHYCARLEAKGMRSVLGTDAAIAALGIKRKMPFIGYVFRAGWADKNGRALGAFFRAVDEANDILRRSDAEWRRLRPLLRTSSDAALLQIKTRYRGGIIAAAVPDTGTLEAAARKLFSIMARQGGRSLTGALTDLPAGTFWNGDSKQAERERPDP